MAVIESILELVGCTSVVRLNKLTSPDSATVWVKCEQQNPGGSVKDRIVLSMLRDAETRGLLKPGGTVIEPTSGNTGIGLALACAVKGYKLVLTMPESMSLERRALLEAYGAELVLTPADEQMEGAIARAKQLLTERKDSWMPSQFDNPANPKCHETSTAVELLEQLKDIPIDAFVAAVGTGGTVTGVGRALHAQRPETRVIAVEPETCATLSRGERGPSKIQGIAAGFVPSNFQRAHVDEVRTVSDERAWKTKVRLAREEGLLVGISAGANVAIALDVAQELGPGRHVVTVLCDTGERYFSLASWFDQPATATPRPTP
ncbi:MAG: cysteine synthase A [Deltaproteobacteria bacterium]|nr:cysteine synthase A [Deltaproteobacteria bacterium]